MGRLRRRDPEAHMSDGTDKSDKPAILQDSEFTVEEGFLYRACRTGAIWLNKVFFSAIFLWFVWMLLGYTGSIDPGCADSYQVIETENGTADQEIEQCSIFLSTTSKYLMGMTIVSFLASIVLGLLGLVVGKNIIEVTSVRDEVGYKAREELAKEAETATNEDEA